MSETAWSTRSHMTPNGESTDFRLDGFAILWAFDKAQHLADRDLLGGPRQQVSAFGAAPRFHEGALFQAGQNEFQELLRDFLPPGDSAILTG